MNTTPEKEQLTEETQPSKKIWSKPEVVSLSAKQTEGKSYTTAIERNATYSGIS